MDVCASMMSQQMLALMSPSLDLMVIGLKYYIRPIPWKSDLNKISNGMGKSINGHRDQNLLIAEVRSLKSFGAGRF